MQERSQPRTADPHRAEQTGGIALELVRNDAASGGNALVEYADGAGQVFYVLAVRRDSLPPPLRAPAPLDPLTG